MKGNFKKLMAKLAPHKVKILICLLSLLVVAGGITTAVILTNGCNHDWQDATCTAPKTCAKCSETEGEALGHTEGTAATCTSKAVCSVCNSEYGEPKAHVYDKSTVKADALKSAATCTEAAVYYKSCACGKVGTDATFTSGEPIAHTYDKNTVKPEALKSAATCTSAAIYYKSCACGKIGDSATFANGDPLPHTFDQTLLEVGGKSALKTAATCTSAAVYYKSCTCGAISTSDADTFTSGTPIPHTYNQETANANTEKAPATCTSAAVYYKSCSCGAVSPNNSDTFTNGDPIPHTFDQEVVKTETQKAPASCASAAVYYKSCECGAVSTSDTDTFTSGTALPHTFDQELTEVNGVSTLKTEANCQSLAVYYKSCTCGAVSNKNVDTFKRGEVGDHVYDQESTLAAAKDPTSLCDAVAYFYKSCECGAISTNPDDRFLVEGFGSHDYQETASVPATCLAAKKVTMTCNCGDYYEEEVGAPLGHSIVGAPVKEEVQIGDTCEYIQMHECQNGDCTEIVEGNHVFHHTYVASITKVATCKDPGEKTLTCSKCSDENSEKEIIPADATGHKWILGTPSGNTRTDTCEHCGEPKTVTIANGTTDSTKAEDLKDKELEINVGDGTNANIQLGNGVIDKIGTDKEIQVSAGKVDKETAGLTPDQLEQVGDNPVFDFTIKDSSNNTISDFGEGNFVTITLPYELKPGEDVDNIAVWYISDKCQDKYCTDGDACTNAAHKLVSIKATYNNGFVTFETNHFSYYTVTRLTPAERCALYGHVYSHKTVEATCTQAGYELHVCIRCRNSYTDNEVDALGHAYSHKTVEATCTASGHTDYECNNCHHSYSIKVKATGHNYPDSPTETVPATCTENGYEKFVCQNENCEAEYKEYSAERAEHVYSDTVVPPTCEEEGYTLHECDNCDYSYIDTYVAANGHSHGVKDSKPASCTQDGYTTYKCDNCDDEYTERHGKAAHDYSTVVTPPSCDTEGYTTYDCDNCDHTYVGDYVAATGHNFKPTWTWASDNKSATLVLVCESNADHKESIMATVNVKIVHGTCSSFTETTYTAAVPYGSEIYTDVKVVTVGTPDHSYASEWKSDDNNHWHECVCGAKTDVTAHEFKNATVTKEPTCGADGESTSTCACGKTHVSAVPATGEHVYENGYCKTCGEKAEVDTYYLNLVNSWKNVNGFAIKIRDFSYEIKSSDTSLLDELKVIGSIKQIDVAELSLYYEDGEFGGAASGSVEIFNGPIRDAKATYTFKAVIHEGFAYFTLKQLENPSEDYSGKIAVDAIIEALLEEMDIEGEAVDVLNFVKDTVLPAIETLVELNKKEIDSILESIFNILFSLEEQSDGSFVATLDYDKLNTLNENLATKPIAEVIDIYFGEGTFDDLAAFAIEILNLKISEIPAYVDEMGLDSADLIAKINELAAKTGAPEGWDLNELVFNNKELEDVTIGMLIFKTEDDSYVKTFEDNFVEPLREAILYNLINEDFAEEIKETVASIIEMASEYLTFSFSTDYTGMLKSVNVALDEFETEIDNTTVYANAEVDILINQKINVTWAGMVDEIEAEIALPTDDMLDEDGYSGINGFFYSGYFEFKGEEYRYDSGFEIYFYKPNYNSLTHVVFYPDCDGWLGYETCYEETYYRFTLAQAVIDEENVKVLINEFSNEVAILVATDTGFIAKYEDGTEREIAFEFETPTEPEENEKLLVPVNYAGNIVINPGTSIPVIPGPSVITMDTGKYVELFFDVFENPEGRVEAFGDYVYYYYNSAKKEYAEESQHELVYDYELDGDYCWDGCTTHLSCEKCDYSYEYRDSYCSSETVTIDLTDYCGGSITADRCKKCGRITNYNYDDMENIGCSMEGKPTEEEITDESGAVIGRRLIFTCPDCGLEFVQAYWKDYVTTCEYYEYNATYIFSGDDCIFEYIQRYGMYDEHEYEYTYEFKGDHCDDGYKVTRHCPKCKETDEWNQSGHDTDYRYVELNDLGLCGGTIREYYCIVCKEIFDSYVEWEKCNWYHVEDNAEGYSVYECHECGAQKLEHYYETEKDENCRYEYTEKLIYVVNGEEVYNTEYSGSGESHNYRYDFDMEGESCDDGYIVTRYCTDCGYSYRYGHYSGHQTFGNELLNGRNDCCEYHYVEVNSCPCGEYFYVYYDSDNLTYYEELNAYVCDECGLMVENYTDSNTSGCVLTVTKVLRVTLGDEVLYNYENSKEYPEHDYSKIEATSIDGTTTVTVTCSKCGDVYVTETKAANNQAVLENHDGIYYYDFTVTPEESGYYVITSMADYDTFVTLYGVKGGELYEINFNDDGAGNGQFYLGEYLTAGETYVYRIRFYDDGRNGIIPFSFTLGDSKISETKCYYHNNYDYGKESRYQYFSVLPEGKKSCVEGVICGRVCTACGHVDNIRTSYEHQTNNNVIVIDLSEYPVCSTSEGSKITLSVCACREQLAINSYYGCYDTNYETDEYYDEELGCSVRVETIYCWNCELTVERMFYSKANGNCSITRYETITVHVGDQLIDSVEVEINQPSHNYDLSFNLAEGATSCEDGAIITYTCAECGYSYSKTVYNHETFETEHIPYNSVCGGGALIKKCACGKVTEVQRSEHGCELYYNWCNLWIENAITGSQEDINGWHYYNTYHYIYTCSVTDPEQCAYHIRYAKYWLAEADECVAYEYETWQFGYNPETGEYDREVKIKTGNRQIYHHYTATNPDNNSTHYDCAVCGSYKHTNNYYDDNERHIKQEILIGNTLTDYSDKKSYEYIEEWARDNDGRTIETRTYYKNVYWDDTYSENENIYKYTYYLVDNGYESYYDSYTSYHYYRQHYREGNEYWYKEENTREDYSASFGEDGYKITSTYTNSNGENRYNENARVFYMGYEYIIYSYSAENEWWERYEYSYSFDGECIRTVVYTNSDNESNTYTENCCYTYYTTIKYPTCTQDGLYGYQCHVCERISDNAYIESPNDHNWVCATENWYYCSRCGLENANGMSGDIVLEDLTELYGNGENYVVGYWDRNNGKFGYYVSLYFPETDEEFILDSIEFTELDGIRAVMFNMARVEELAIAAGYTDSALYDIRFAFVPESAAGLNDYAITFTPTTENAGVITGNTSFVDYVGEGETVSYTITPTEDGVWTFTSFSNYYGTTATLYDSDGNQLAHDYGYDYENFKIVYRLKAGETYTLSVRWTYGAGDYNSMPLLFTYEPLDVPDVITESVSFVDYVGSGETVSYTITPTEDGVWTFTAYGEYGTIATLYDSNGNQLAYSGNYYENFKIVYRLKAGESYTLSVNWYYDNDYGTMPLLFTYEPLDVPDVITESVSFVDYLGPNGAKYTIVPNEDSIFKFSCYAEYYGIYAYVYDSNGVQIAYSTNLAEDYNLACRLKAGEVYTLTISWDTYYYGYISLDLFFEPTEIIDVITESTSFENSIYVNEKLSYTIMPTENSVWTFLSSENPATTGGVGISIDLYDEAGVLLYSDAYCSMNFQHELYAGATYTLKIESLMGYSGVLSINITCESLDNILPDQELT